MHVCVCVCVCTMSYNGDDDSSGGVNPEEFYMVLPSNACAETHPDNTASKYVVSWKNPLILKDSQKWSVALIEANMEYPKYALVKGHGIFYKGTRMIEIPICEQRLKITVAEDKKTITYDHVDEASRNWVFPWREGIHVLHFKPPSISVAKKSGNFHIESYNIRLTSPRPFQASFKYDHADTPTWYTSLPVPASEGGGHRIDSDAYYVGKESPPLERIIKYDVKFEPHEAPWMTEILVEETTTARDVFELCRIVKRIFHDIVDNCTIQSNGIMMMLFKRGVHEVKFLKGLHKVCGFDKFLYTFPNRTVQNSIFGNQHAQLNLGVQYVYIYSSVSAPMNVGGEMVPLLRSVCLDGKHSELPHGQIINHIMEHPMYVPVVQSIINSVEFNIRTNSGEFVPFGAGAVTTLTLHFKKRH